jgi:hypothetical protein
MRGITHLYADALQEAIDNEVRHYTRLELAASVRDQSREARNRID